MTIVPDCLSALCDPLGPPKVSALWTSITTFFREDSPGVFACVPIDSRCGIGG
jgi:hypothetical protein